MPKSPFARLFSSARSARSQEDEDDVIERKKDDAEDNLTDPDDPDDEKDEGDLTDEEKEAALKARKAKKAKAKAKDGDDESDDADDKDPKAKAARARERGRIAAIMSSDAAAANPAAALFMATRTSTSRDEAIANLTLMGAVSNTPSGSRAAARERLAGVDVPSVGQGDGEHAKGATAQAAAIIRAGKRRRGEA